jgi:hypothetical protein
MAMQSSFLKRALKMSLGTGAALVLAVGTASAHGGRGGGSAGGSGYSGSNGGRVNPIVKRIHPIVRSPIVNTIHRITVNSPVSGIIAARAVHRAAA